MSDASNLFRALEDEWDRKGRSPEARAALARWAVGAPSLAALIDPATLVQRCHARDEEASSLLEVVLRHAEQDALAARTMLQAVLPGLGSVTRRAGCYVGGNRPVWQSRGELHQQVVCVALDRILALATSAPEFPCRAIVDGTWQRLRHHALSVRRELDHRADLEFGAGVSAAPDRTAIEELGLVLMAAIDLHVLDVFDAGLVYSCHVAGYRITELARLTARSERTLWRRRHRAEELLAGSSTIAVRERARQDQEGSRSLGTTNFGAGPQAARWSRSL